MSLRLESLGHHGAEQVLGTMWKATICAEVGAHSLVSRRNLYRHKTKPSITNSEERVPNGAIYGLAVCKHHAPYAWSYVIFDNLDDIYKHYGLHECANC